MKTWAVVNQKGGVGKTTSAITLAGHCSQTSRRQLLVDLDPHGSLTSYLGYDPDKMETGIFRLFSEPTTNQADIAQMLLPTRLPNTWLFAASSALARFDREVGTGSGLGLVVTRAIKSVASKFDQGIIDCPPMLGALMINAMAASDQLLIPAQTDYLSLTGLRRMVHTLGMIETSLKRKIPYLVLPTMYDKRTRASVDALQQMRDLYKSAVWHSCIPIDTKFRDASKAGMPLSEYAPKSKGSIAYGELMQTMIELQPDDEIQLVKSA